MDTILSIIGWVVSLGSDLYQVGISEDGSPVTAEALYIIATSPEGRRFRHNHTWATMTETWETDPEDGQMFQCFPSTLVEDKAAAEFLADKVQKTGHIDTEFWQRIQPVYGSQAYRRTYYENEAALDRY